MPVSSKSADEGYLCQIAELHLDFHNQIGKWISFHRLFQERYRVTPNNTRHAVTRCWQRGPSSFHRKNDGLSAFAILIAIFNHDTSMPTFATTVPTCAGHLRIVPVSVFRVETKHIVFMTFPMHNWAPYWLFRMVYPCVPHFNLWRGHKHPCSFQLRIALNLKSTRHYMGIDLDVKSRTSAQHNCKI